MRLSRRRAVLSKIAVHNIHRPNATSEASAPKTPLLSQSAPVRVETSQPSAEVPDTGMPYKPCPA